MNMWTPRTCLCGISILWLLSAEATYRYDNTCQCNGRSQYCTVDAQGVVCLNCQGNTEGRQCERCKAAFYHQRAGESCLPCDCSPTGAVGDECDSQGRCRCKPGVQGEKCDRCPSGMLLTKDGCTQSRDQSECFCYGHTAECSLAKGYSIYNISSTFSNGDEAWTAAEANGVTPPRLHFRWSPSHGDLEVISTESVPVYLSAPAAFLGNQVLSYGQSLSFSLRLDRGVRRPSTSDVVLEGAGLRVSASLGNLRTVLPAGQRTIYTFRLDERAGSKWQPQLSSMQFQKLLQNLTAIKIRGTFGENGRGYLDNVHLVSARIGPGAPAGWVGNCTCPTGYEGQFCERCGVGYTRQSPAHGPFSPCTACQCPGGSSCDSQTGDCYSGDENSAANSCSAGYYSDPAKPHICRACPCPQGASCSVMPGSLEVKCDSCSPGVTGPLCNICENGFYGDPKGEYGPPQACKPCRCGGPLNPNVLVKCDRVTGFCPKCIDHTTGFFCERCEDGFYRTDLAQACKPCSCNVQGSLSKKCSDSGQCLCGEGSEGLKCDRSSCPSCFDPVKSQVAAYRLRLKEMEALFAGMESGKVPVTDSQVENTLRKAEKLVADLQKSADKLSDTESQLQGWVTGISKKLFGEEKNLQSVSDTVDGIKEHDQGFKKQLSSIRWIITDIRDNLSAAKRNLRLVDLPLGDSDGTNHALSGLVDKATDLANTHQGEAKQVEGFANTALKEAEKALALMRSAITGENKVTELINDLKTKYDRSSARVKALEDQGKRVSSSAGDESRVAADALKQIASLAKNLPNPLKEMGNVAAVLDALKDSAEKNLTELQDLNRDVQVNKAKVEGLLAKGEEGRKKQDLLLARVNAAKAGVDESLKDINANIDGLNQVLDNLKGFDTQIDANKDLADKAISKLPAINATIQEAVGKNAQTQGVLDSVAGDYKQALDSVKELDNALQGMKGVPGTLTASDTLLKGATTLKDNLKGLKDQALDTMGKLTAKKDDVDQQNERAKEALADAHEAYGNAKNTKDAVGDTMKAIKDLLGLFGQSASVDENKLKELEESVTNMRNTVTKKLKPQLQDLEEKEARQKGLIAQMDSDIDRILKDIKNVQDIVKIIPKGCVNLLPVERP
ncbi:laminin subunit gamma-2 [Conger conger]|uniref:laminin subunit gamma-2 n=1 Tax=Conger conger TaxID=82655 RepID=UPI002A59DFA9|nr:laminin subunit gamma-2 [Conger conger]